MDADRVRIGMVRLTDAAPLVFAQAHGLFAAADLEVGIAVEPSWANVADKLAWGLLDAAVMLHPLAIAMALGLRGPATALRIPAGISLNGNAITLSRGLAEPVLRDGPGPPAQIAARLRRAIAPGEAIRLAVVHDFSTHDLLLRRFLESGGIDPARDVRFSVVPPPEMPDALAAGRIDGFCAGAPWSAVAAQIGAGRTVALTSAIWPNHPEKCLAVGKDWAEANRSALARLLEALGTAGRACDDAANTPALAQLLARPEWVGVPAALIAGSLPGGSGTDSDRSVFAAPSATTPDPDAGRWFLEQIARRWPVPHGAELVVAELYQRV